MNLEQFFALMLKIRPLISLKPRSFTGWAALHFAPELFAFKSPKHGYLGSLLLALTMHFVESYISFRFLGLSEQIWSEARMSLPIQLTLDYLDNKIDLSHLNFLKDAH